jgi:hypothetical protein
VTSWIRRLSVGISTEYPARQHDSAIAVPLTLRLSRAISLTDYDPVRRGACVGFCLRGDKWATLSARQGFCLLAWNAGILV